MRKKYLIVLDSEIIDVIDQKVIRPCSRSDVINDSMKYLLQSPYIIEAFVNDRNKTMLDNAMRDIPTQP